MKMDVVNAGAGERMGGWGGGVFALSLSGSGH